MERQQRHTSDRPEAGPNRRYLGHWPDVTTYGRKLAEEMGLADYVWQVPRVIQPYVRLDYELIVRDMCEVGGLDVIEAPDGIHVYEALQPRSPWNVQQPMR